MLQELNTNLKSEWVDRVRFGAWFLMLFGCGVGLVDAQGPVSSPVRSADRSSRSVSAATPGEQDFSRELPRILPKTPAESMAAMKIKLGFHAELVASEPLIRSPMAIDFDEYGRAFVVELPEYNQYASPKPHGKGAIKMLEDRDGDGRYDSATVYVDDLNYPTAVACWDGGVLVGVAPDLLFCKDMDGDGKADLRRRLFTGFGTDHSGEGMLNSIRWRIDNRFHISSGLDGGEVVRTLDQAATAERVEEKAINVRGQHLYLEPRAMALTATSGGGQHGMSLDDWNLRTFVCGNSEPVHVVMYDGRYLLRNPLLEAPAAAINIAPDGKYTKLMRVSQVEPWRALRTRLRSAGAIPGSDEGGQASGFFTGATGITLYRGDAWPAEYRGQVFVGEVSNNLVYRAELEPQGVGLVARRADQDAEFLASSDNWFRPVQFANAPDGTLYVLDMYRELIEGAAFLAPQILKHMDPSAGSSMGRIYRIAPDSFQFQAPPRLGDLATHELVPLLEHPNAWHRETASRLIYQRQDGTAVDPLRMLVMHSSSPLARVIGLYALQGLGALDAELVETVLQGSQENDSIEVRIHALRLAESWPEEPSIREAVGTLAHHPQMRVRYQAAFSLGEFRDDESLRELVELAIQDGADPWMQLAILSSVGQRRADFVHRLLTDPQARQRPHVPGLIGTVAVQIGADKDRQELVKLLQDVERVIATDRRLGESVLRSLISRQSVTRDLLASVAGVQTRELSTQMLLQAQGIALNGEKPEAERVGAIQLLLMAPLSEQREVFEQLLKAQQPRTVQVVALRILARFDDPDVARLILAAWPAQTPALRSTSVETLFARPAWIMRLLDAMEGKTVQASELEPARVALLQKHDRTDIRERSAKLFANAALARRQEVVDAYQESLVLPGDVGRGRAHFAKVCSACHKLENVGESIGADLKAVKDRGTAAVLLNILDPNREVKPQFQTYLVLLNNGRTITGMIVAETATSLTLRKADHSAETVLRVDIEELQSSGISFMPEGLEKQLDVMGMADLLAYLNSIQ